MKTLEDLVSRKVSTLFPDPQTRQQVEQSLLAYTKGNAGFERICLAVLKLCEGNIEKLNIKGAEEDPEDMISWAECPEWTALAMANRKLNESEISSIQTRDWEQYHKWLIAGLK